MQPLIETVELKKYFKVGSSQLHAVDSVSLQIPQGTTLGIVGESGCGKSTLGRTILGLQPATGGRILYKGRDITKLSATEQKKLRREIQIIFQDPYSSINPRHPISRIIGEPIRVNGLVHGKADLEKRVRELMDIVGLAPRLYNAYPHELDGGRRQRVGIARALGLNPEFIVCDEPVSALDVSIQAQILNLLEDLQDQLGLTYMFITHDLSVVHHLADEIAVMYLGQLVEKAPTVELFTNPLHPYTKALLSAIPVPDIHHKSKRILLNGEISSPINLPDKCRFCKRCFAKKDKCESLGNPQLVEVSPNHFVACHLFTE